MALMQSLAVDNAPGRRISCLFKCSRLGCLDHSHRVVSGLIFRVCSTQGHICGYFAQDNKKHVVTFFVSNFAGRTC